jgi:hypothetical protein
MWCQILNLCFANNSTTLFHKKLFSFLLAFNSKALPGRCLEVWVANAILKRTNNQHYFLYMKYRPIIYTEFIGSLFFMYKISKFNLFLATHFISCFKKIQNSPKYFQRNSNFHLYHSHFIWELKKEHYLLYMKYRPKI